MTALPVKPKPRTYLAWRITPDNMQEAANFIGGNIISQNGDTALEAWPGDPLPIFEGEWVVASEDGVDVTAYSNDEFQRTYTTA